MIKTCRLGGAKFTSPDVERLVQYYTDVIGLKVAGTQDKTVFLSCGLGHDAIAVTHGEAAVTTISLQMPPSFDLKEIQRYLQTEGVESEIRSDLSPTIEKALHLVDPNGLGINLFAKSGMLPVDRSAGGIQPLSFGHIAFTTGDVPGCVKYYTSLLGFRVSDWMEDRFAFLRCGPEHHTVNFAAAKSSYLHHLAFELKDWAHMQQACETLGIHELPIIWGPGRHGIGHNLFIYHRNPDDHVVEFFTELDQMSSEELGYFDPRPWHKDSPQYPKVWSAADASLTWGPPRTSEYLRRPD